MYTVPLIRTSNSLLKFLPYTKYRQNYVVSCLTNQWNETDLAINNLNSTSSRVKNKITALEMGPAAFELVSRKLGANPISNFSVYN
jgi:hypothetical protein